MLHEESPSADAEPAAVPRAAIDELQRVGPLYAALNIAAPLVRLAALGTFVFGNSSAYRELLCAVIAAIFVGVVRPLLFRAGGVIASQQVPKEGGILENGDPLTSSLFHQLRLVWSQALRCVLLATLLGAWAFATSLNALRVGYREHPGDPPLSVDEKIHMRNLADLFPGGASKQVGVGVAAFGLMAVVWSLVHSVSPREQLASEAPNDLSAANEDELLRGMRSSLRLCSLSARCASVALETSADVLLLYVFLPSLVEGAEIPTPAALRANPLTAIPTALAYGSQHLRFRLEWLLCVCFGLGHAYLLVHFDGSLLAPLVAALCFAVFRHWRRTGLDARRAHKQ